MKKKWVVLVILVILSTMVSAECIKPMNSKTYTQDQAFCSGTFYLPDGIKADRNNIVIDCNYAVLQGRFQNTGITIANKKNIVIKNCNIANYAIGIYLHNSTNITIYDNTLMRNHAGIKLVNSSNNYFDENRDISLERPLRIVYSFNNTIKYVNKDLEEDYCRYNKCNVKSKITFNDEESLLSTLKSAISAWIN